MKTGLFTPASRRPLTMRPAASPSTPWSRPSALWSPNVTRTWVRPRARAMARASDRLPVPACPARQRTDPGTSDGLGRTASAGGGSVSAVRPRRGVSTVSRPRACGHAASTSMMRVLTGSRPPWVRSSTCFRCSGSNRCGSRVRHGRERTVSAWSSASSTASASAASACRTFRRSFCRTGPGRPAASRVASTWSSRAPGVTSARTASSAGPPEPPSRRGGAAAAGPAGGWCAASGRPAPSSSRPNACAGSTTRARPDAARSGRSQRARCSAVVTTQQRRAGSPAA